MSAGLLLMVASVFSMMPFLFIYLLIVELLKATPGIAAMGQLLLFALLSYFCAYAFLFVGYHLSHAAAYKILCDLRVELGEHLTKLPLGYFNRVTTGELATTINESVERLELFLAHHFPEMISIVSAPVLLAVLLFIVDWRMALASVG
ncbi:MAG: ABC transporter ATP-binding protein, partial [Parvularculaceae bacterium]|nr:ABC transporter ATP-binding protein [Parvularculaceae bacterium]